jgi:prepilin-type N-terminal cleavage/methylation domain-containing protein
MSLYNARKSNSGFTLIEMLAVFIIIGVIAAIAVPNFLGLLNRNRVKDGLAQVEGAVKEAQRQAMRKGKVCKIRFTSNAEGNSVIEVHPDELPVRYNGCLLTSRILPDSVSFSLLNSGTLTVVNSSNVRNLAFSNKGNPDVQGTMVISHPQSNTQKCIQIEGMLGTVFTGDYVSATTSCEAR